MADAEKGKEVEINIKPLTSLQKLMISAEFDGFIIFVILLNCIFMASESPVLTEPLGYIVATNWFFNVVFIMELTSQIVAFGVLPYFSDYWHWLDAIVVATSVLDIVVAILALLQGLIKGVTITFNVKVLRVLRVIRFFRILRPLKALRYFKGILVFIESLTLSADILAITTGLFMLALVSISFITNAIIGNTLLKRCVPLLDPLTEQPYNGSTAYTNADFQAYGIAYYTSQYNLEYCRDNSYCQPGYECLLITGIRFLGIPGDFSTPWSSFKTNLAFVTLRGWPLIFAAIKKGFGMTEGYVVLLLNALICPLFILNMFPAIFIISLKRCEDSQLRLDWLKYFPGDKETVSELELFTWANRNQSLFFKLDNESSNPIAQIAAGCGYLLVCIGLVKRPVKVEAERPAIKDVVEAKKMDEDIEERKEEIFDEDEPYVGTEEENPDFGKGKRCVPKGRSMGALRSIFTNESSPFSMFINFVIILNILSLAVDADSTPTYIRLIVLYLNFAFISIFMLEVVVKIALLGPCLYLDNPFNLLDFTLVILSIPTFVSTSFQVIGNLRILRLARLAKLAQITRLQKQLNQDAAGAKQEALKTSINLSRLAGMLSDLMNPMINNIVLVLIIMYIYALIGMQFFAAPNAAPYDLPPFNLTLIVPYGTVQNTTAEDLGTFFYAGRYLKRMNFNVFGNAFVTVFNIGTLNGWYLFMINTIRLQESEGVLWYFFSYIYLVLFLFGSTLIASVASVMDGHAKAMIRDIASANKSVVDRYAFLARRQRLRIWFKVLKKNTVEGNDEPVAAEAGLPTKLKREMVADSFEDPPQEPLLSRFRRERQQFSLYLFSRRNYIRRLLKFFVESLFFQVLITVSVLVAVVGVIASSIDLNKINLGPISIAAIIVIVFISEMLFLWVVYGLWGSPDAYFNQPLYLIDFFVNIAMVYAFFSNVDVLNQLRLFRLLKLPNLLLYVSDSNTLRLFFTMLFESMPSLISVLTMSLAIIFLSAVVGVQLYTGTFGHCSSDVYPGGRGRYVTDPVDFPQGCFGTGYDSRKAYLHPGLVFNNVTGYGDGTVLTGLHWQSGLDNFESIFTACKSMLRVTMANEWEGVLFQALDKVGVNFQPKTNFSRSAGAGSFIFFYIISLLGITFGALYISIFYYHFVITCILSGRKSLIGRQDAMWAMYEEKLILVKPSNRLASGGNKNSLRNKLIRLYRRNDVRIIIILYVVVPIVLLFGYYGSIEYSDQLFIFYDTIFTIIYLLEYIVRGMSTLTFKRGIMAMYRTTNITELVLVVFLIVSVLVNTSTFTGGDIEVISPGNTRQLAYVCASAILRAYRIAILFPEALKVMEVMKSSLFGFVSLCIYAIIVIMIFGLLGYDVMNSRTPTYGNLFIDDTLNFTTLANSWFTLIAIGTGNYYSEVLNNAKQEYRDNFGFQVFVELFFLLFYLLFFLTLKSFAIQIIMRYESSFGASLGIANEQVSTFQHSWRLAHHFDKIDYNKLADLLGTHLPPPLGLAGTDMNYLELSRFMKRVLLCMPCDQKRCDDLDPTKNRVLFAPETIPSDVRNISETWNPSKLRFTFRQVIVATHKRALFDFVLADESAVQAAREVHKDRLDKIIILLGRLTLSRYDVADLPFKAMLFMQRTKPAMYRAYFVSMMSAQLHNLMLKINVFGFNPFDAFISSTLRDAMHLELRASHLQLDVKKSQELAAHHSRVSVLALEEANKFYSSVKKLTKRVDQLYESNMKSNWDLDSLDQYANSKERRAVSAVAIDFSGKIYVALNSGLLKIYKTRDYPGLPLRLVHKIMMKAHIRSLVVSSDAKKIFVGCANNVVVLVLASSKKRLNYKELLRFSAHSAAVNVVLPFGRFILSAGQDSMIYLWRLNSREPANSYDTGSPVFCMCVMPVIEENVAVDDRSLADVLLAGTQKGRLWVLALPLLSSNNESAFWEGFSVEAGECGVSSVQVAWGFVYAGLTDGRVKTWAVEMRKDKSTLASPIKMVNLLPVQSVQVHAGPVTCLAYTGGCLFSASYDFSILPWVAPDRMQAKTAANFSQSYREGVVYHSNSILSVASNKRMIVTGDEGGRVIVIYPKKVREDFMSSGADSGSANSKPLFNFSFIEYDFGRCFLDNNGGVIEEEIILSVQNCSGSAANIRCLLKRHPCFRVEVCDNQNRNNGNEIVTLQSSGSKVSNLATRFDALNVVQYRIIFHPLDARIIHLAVQFLINEKDMVRIQLRGGGCKSKIYMDHNAKLFEMGTVGIGQYGVERVTIENKEDRPILVNCLAECEDKKENAQYEIKTVKHNMAARHTSIIPRCFSIPPHEHVELLIRFNSPVKMDVFRLPIRAIYGGGEGTLAEIRVRAADPPGSVARDTMASPPTASSKGGLVLVPLGSQGGGSQMGGSQNEGLGLTGSRRGSVRGSLKSNEENDIDDERSIASFALFDEVKARQYMYRGLRALSPSETPCPSDLLVSLLHNIGWKLALENQLACLVHPESGLFIEIPDCNTCIDNLTGMASVSELKVDFMCADSSTYEIWYSDRLIKKGVGKQDILNSVYIDVHDLYHLHESSFIGSDSPPKKIRSSSVGQQMLELMVYSSEKVEGNSTGKKSGKKGEKGVKRVQEIKPPMSTIGTQPDGRILLHVTYIKIYKGYRLGLLKPIEDNGSNDGKLQLLERIVVGGIMRVVTFLDNDMGAFTEVFERDVTGFFVPDDEGAIEPKKRSILGSASPVDNIFAPAILTINTAFHNKDFIPDKNDAHKHLQNPTQEEGPTHVKVTDIAAALELRGKTGESVIEHKAEIEEGAKTITGMKTFYLEKPVLTGEINLRRCARDVSVQLLKKPAQDGMDDMVKIETLASTEVAGHAAMHMRSESEVAPFENTRSVLPHLIHSHRHGVYLQVIGPKNEPIARTKHLNTLLDQVALDGKIKDLLITSLFNGQYYFVVDRNSLKLVSSSLVDPIDTLDLNLLTRGFVADFNGETDSCLAAMDGRSVATRSHEELPRPIRAILSKLQVANNQGISGQFQDAPLFLRGKWSQLVKYSLHRKVVTAMLSMVERQRVVAAGRAAQEAANIIKEYEAFLATSASSGGSKIAKKGLDANKKKEAEDQAKALLNAAPSTTNLTFREVYADITRNSNELAYYTTLEEKTGGEKHQEHDTKSKNISALMNLLHLSSYLQTEVLSGFDDPLTGIEADAVLESMKRNPQTNGVKLEEFEQWYKSDDEKKLRAELKAKKVFPVLLEETLYSNKHLNETDAKPVKGSRATKVIKDMHLTLDEDKWVEDQKILEGKTREIDPKLAEISNSTTTSESPKPVRKRDSNTLHQRSSLTAFMESMNSRLLAVKSFKSQSSKKGSILKKGRGEDYTVRGLEPNQTSQLQTIAEEGNEIDDIGDIQLDNLESNYGEMENRDGDYDEGYGDKIYGEDYDENYGKGYSESKVEGYGEGYDGRVLQQKPFSPVKDSVSSSGRSMSSYRSPMLKALKGSNSFQSSVGSSFEELEESEESEGDEWSEESEDDDEDRDSSEESSEEDDEVGNGARYEESNEEYFDNESGSESGSEDYEGKEGDSDSDSNNDSDDASESDDDSESDEDSNNDNDSKGDSEKPVDEDHESDEGGTSSEGSGITGLELRNPHRSL